MTTKERAALVAAIKSAARIEAYQQELRAHYRQTYLDALAPIPLSPEEERALSVLRGLVRLGAIGPVVSEG